jgi:hypothetical protein
LKNEKGEKCVQIIAALQLVQLVGLSSLRIPANAEVEGILGFVLPL